MRELGSDLCVYCWSLLNLEDIARLERVCKSFREILNSPEGLIIFEIMDLRVIRDPNPLWLMRKVLIFRPKSLLLQGSELDRNVLLTVLKEAGPTLTTLDLSFTNLTDHDIPTAISFCPMLEDLRLDKRCPKDRILQCVLTALPCLKHLSLRYNSFLQGTPFLSFPVSLQSLAIEECQHFSYEAVYALASRSSHSLTSLSIDGEAYSTAEVCALIASLPRLTTFSVFFAGEHSDSLLAALKGYALQKLYIKKGALLSSAAFQDFFSVRYPKLEVLELIECGELDDLALLEIAEHCANLRTLNLSWCTEITDSGLIEIVRRCDYLRYMELVGLKCVTDQAFPLDESLPIYENLLALNCTKSDYVSDDHLHRISTLYPQIDLKNYYGEGKGNWRIANSPYPSATMVS